MVTGNLGKIGKSNQSEKFSIFTGNENRLSFKVVFMDSKGRSNLLRCCLNSMQNNVCWLLVCSKYAATTHEHGIVFPLKRMEIMLWHKQTFSAWRMLFLYQISNLILCLHHSASGRRGNVIAVPQN